jgi:hypothetical protein
LGQSELVTGKGFRARVAVSGRALLIDEGREMWVESVNPGGLAAQGRNLGEALAKLGSAFRSLLHGLACEAESFGHFRSQVEGLFAATSPVTVRDWEAAVQQVKSGQLGADWLSRRPAESPLSLEVAEVASFHAAEPAGEAALAT